MNNFWKSMYARLDLIVLLACLLITYAIWSYGSGMDRSSVDLLEDSGHEVKIALAEEVNNTFAFMDGVRGLYVSSEGVSDEELGSFMKVAGKNHLGSAVLRINYVEKIPNLQMEDKAKIVEGYKDQFVVTQSVDTKGQTFDPSYQNLLDDPDSRKLVELMESGKSRAVSAVESVGGVSQYSGPGFVYVAPVHRDGELVGIVSAIVSNEKMIEQVEALVPSDGGWSWDQDDVLINEKTLETRLVYDTVSLTIPVTDFTNWNITLSKVSSLSTMWGIVLAVGVVISFVIYVVIYALITANIRGENMAKRMTLDLEKYKLALDSASNHVVITDEEGVVLYANKSAQKLTGYSNDEILGQTPRLWGGQMPKDFYTKFWHQIKQEKRVYSGIFNNKRKNGEKYLAEATVSPILDETQKLVGFVGVEEDVTAERKILDENNANLQKLAKFNELMVGRELKMVEMKKVIADLKAKYEK